MAGLNGSHRCATLGLSRSAAIVYWIRSLEPMLTKSTSGNSASMVSAAAGTSTMMPSGMSSANATPSRRRAVRVRLTTRLSRCTSSSVLIIGKSRLTLPNSPARRMARSWVPKNSG